MNISRVHWCQCIHYKMHGTMGSLSKGYTGSVRNQVGRFRFPKKPVVKNQELEPKILKFNLFKLTSIELLLSSLVLSRSKSERSFECMRF